MRDSFIEKEEKKVHQGFILLFSLIKIPQMWLVIKSGQYLRLKDNKHKMSSFVVQIRKQGTHTYTHIWLEKNHQFWPKFTFHQCYEHYYWK